MERGHKICFMAEYYLPDLRTLKALPSDYEFRVLTPADFKSLYLPEWSNALCKDRKELDVLGVGAYDNGKLIGLSGCSEDAKDMWQIGIDVLPDYRKRGIGTALVKLLRNETMRRGAIPYYGTSLSNLRSWKIALASGFKPAWVESETSKIEKNKFEK